MEQEAVVVDVNDDEDDAEGMSLPDEDKKPAAVNRVGAPMCSKFKRHVLRLQKDRTRTKLPYHA
jgi:hypothetical protein